PSQEALEVGTQMAKLRVPPHHIERVMILNLVALPAVSQKTSRVVATDDTTCVVETEIVANLVHVNRGRVRPVPAVARALWRAKCAPPSSAPAGFAITNHEKTSVTILVGVVAVLCGSHRFDLKRRRPTIARVKI